MVAHCVFIRRHIDKGTIDMMDVLSYQRHGLVSEDIIVLAQPYDSNNMSSCFLHVTTRHGTARGCSKKSPCYARHVDCGVLVDKTFTFLGV